MLIPPPPPKLGFHDFHDTITVRYSMCCTVLWVDSHQQTISALYSTVQYSTLKQFKQKQLDLPDPTNCLKV